MGAMAAPIAPGKLEDWEAWVGELNGSRKAEFDDMNKRFDVTDHRAWLQQSLDGQNTVVAVWDGPGGDDFLSNVMTSDHEFDTWFREKVSDIHGIDLAAPPPPPAVRWL